MERNEPELKRLEFVRVIALNALLCASNLFDYAKQNSGPLKSAVGKVENAVMLVVAPVFEKFKDVPSQFLVFLDNKVDEAAKKFDDHAPIIAKRAVSEGQYMIKKACEEVQVMVKDFQDGGASATIQHAAALFKQMFVWGSVRFFCYLVNTIRPFNLIAFKAIPILSRYSEKYNETVTGLTTKGYAVVSHFPLIPVEEMAMAYNQHKSASSASAGGASSASAGGASSASAAAEKSGTKDE